MAGFILKTLKKFRIENSVLKEIGNIQEEEIVIPDGVRVIGAKVFFKQKQIKKVIIPDSVRLIDYRAFSYCENLEEIEIPDSVEEIGEYCFAGCKNLKKVKLSASLKIIKKNAFAWCKSLEEIEIPPFVRTIGEDAFHCCENLKTVSFGSAVFKIQARKIDVWIDGELKYILPYFYCIFEDNDNYDSYFGELDYDLKIEAALLRLKVNYQLTEEYREKYIAYLKNRFNEVVIYCIDHHLDDIAVCEEIGLFQNQENIFKAIDYANQIQNIDMAAFLMNYQHEHFDKSENFLNLEEL